MPSLVFLRRTVTMSETLLGSALGRLDFAEACTSCARMGLERCGLRKGTSAKTGDVLEGLGASIP